MKHIPDLFTELSSIIQEVKSVRLSNTRASISWTHKTMPNMQYAVICKECNNLRCYKDCPKSVRVNEIKTIISGENRSSITGLKRGQDYLFKVVVIINLNETSKDVKLKGKKAFKSSV